ncbi:Cbb3-type cytochrome c oxidase subunit CcoP2 [Phycisphaerae bacterium RAS1]|nr:Cbb3-type cytochrome c oxidase subunit CcoP2 [Phycisphaerae bacterium RAS1]
MSQAQDILLDHNYDGIQEYDNPTPGWWWLLLYGSVVFSVAYFLFYTFNPEAETIWKEHEAAVAADLRLQFGEIGDLAADEATILKYMNDQKWLAVGKSTFAARCVSCHGATGNGLVGPNMTDDSYKNVKVIEDIARVIANGAANGAMPAWKNQLHPNEIVLTAAYMASLRGQNLAGPRGAEGDAIPPWPKAPVDTAEKK